MLSIDIVVPHSAPRLWQEVVIGRLRADGYDIAVLHEPGSAGWPAMVNAILALERRVFRRTDPGLAALLSEIPASSSKGPVALRLDLTGNAAPSDIPTIALKFDNCPFDASIAAVVAAGTLPVIEAILDGKTVVGRAWPMIDRRESVALGVEDVLARGVTLIVSTVRAFAENRLDSGEPLAEEASIAGHTALDLHPPIWPDHCPGLAAKLCGGCASVMPIGASDIALRMRRASRQPVRFGTGWSVLPDDGGHFYADPFAFQWQGRDFLFVEDYPHATGKAVISVVPFDAGGTPQEPRCILEEPHHLSYPQVFERDGSVWMLPEASASGKLTLYRSIGFPDRWVAEAVLIEGEVSDATLLDHHGRLWLFATNRDGYGSTSDTLVVFHAPSLTGPWTAHALNPILIDRRMARPGGAFIRGGNDRIFLPVQDGTLGYGGGLGLSELLELNDQTVRLSAPRPIAAQGDWPYPKIHTLNRSGRLEVIDGIAAVRK